MTKIVCEVYSRVSGYYRPVSQFNKGKREEPRERKLIPIQKIIDGIDKKHLVNEVQECLK